MALTSLLGIEREIMRLGGLARTSDLYAAGYWQSMVQLYATYGRIVSVRKGWWATRHSSAAAIAARRAGGRLACVSALAYYGVGEGDARLHLALHRSHKSPTGERLVAHWSRAELPGNRAAVSLAVAQSQARACLQPVAAFER